MKLYFYEIVSRYKLPQSNIFLMVSDTFNIFIYFKIKYRENTKIAHALNRIIKLIKAESILKATGFIYNLYYKTIANLISSQR